MPQVIETRLMNGDTNETLTDQFVLASSHREAIELALRTWTNGEYTTLHSMQREGEEQWVPSGPAWRSLYRCTIQDEEGVSRQFYALLFAQYKQKEGEEGIR